ncbi:hypothetical protein BDW60DRAFT_206594 [Aspergillus nidulans var. acristatus]
MLPYIVSLAALSSGLGCVFYHQRQRTNEDMAKQSTVDERLEIIDEELHNIHQTSATEQFMVFRNQLLLVYVCATAAGWLQGSSIYSLYKNTHRLPDATIVALFATGFLCAGVNGTFFRNCPGLAIHTTQPRPLQFGRDRAGFTTVTLQLRYRPPSLSSDTRSVSQEDVAKPPPLDISFAVRTTLEAVTSFSVVPLELAAGLKDVTGGLEIVRRRTLCPPQTRETAAHKLVTRQA